MKYIFSTIFFIGLTAILNADLYKEKELFIEEQVSSATGTFTEIKRIPTDEPYRNKTKKTAKFFLGEKLGGSISSGGKITLEKPEGKKSSIKIDLGTVRFRIKPLEKEEIFTVRSPSAVAGVRGTSFSIYLKEDGDQKIALPEGKLEVRKGAKIVNLNAGEKVEVNGGDLLDALVMSEAESKEEMEHILADVRYRNEKIEKALEKYEDKIKGYKGKIEDQKQKDTDKVKKIIEDEIEKAERAGDIEEIDELEKVKLNFDSPTKNTKVQRAILAYNTSTEKMRKRYAPSITRENEKLEDVFRDEIADSIKDGDRDTARDLNSWMKEAVQGIKVYPRYFVGLNGGHFLFNDDGTKNNYDPVANTTKGEDKWELKKNFMTNTYKSNHDIYETHDDGLTFRCIKGGDTKYSYEKPQYILYAISNIDPQIPDDLIIGDWIRDVKQMPHTFHKNGKASINGNSNNAYWCIVKNQVYIFSGLDIYVYQYQDGKLISVWFEYKGNRSYMKAELNRK